MNQTVFGDLRQRALAVYRVQTQASIYIVGIHELRGRKFVIVRGEPGSDREHVVVRDSDPRIGEHSLFELAIDRWPGKSLEVATMTSSEIVSVEPERDQVAIQAVSLDGQVDRSPWARPDPDAPAGGSLGNVPHFRSPRPGGLPDHPVIAPGRARGTNPAADAALPNVAKQVVVGGKSNVAATAAASAQEPEPYPQRHVKYAESCAQLLRSLNRRDRIFEDLAHDKPLRDRLRKSLDDCVDLLEQIRRRDRR